ncbi:MAG: DUF2922 domain-containing protein [Defluviitaleaceae bacterium]|nr:DUF2922 domain-containing protein [Defluviitaleaceae bacterium]
MSTPQVHFTLKFKTDLGKVATLRIPRGNEHKTVNATNLSISGLIGNGAVMFGSGAPIAAESVHITETSRRAVV